MADSLASTRPLAYPRFVPPPPPPRLAPPPPPPPAASKTLLSPYRASLIRWRWKHLLAFGFLAFGLPESLTRTFSTDARVSELLDQALFFQIIGYLLAGMLAVHMVRKEQNGDWATLGISWDNSLRRELLTGAAFGLGLLAAFLPVSFVLQGGELRTDELVRLLVGSTSGIGLLLASVVVVIGAPLIEEIYYRGLLYEKLARRNVWVAIVVTAVLFTLAHGALLIPAILLIGFALAWQRRKHTLWYTMGAHAAWNLSILIMAGFVVLGGWSFAPVDGSYEVSFPKAWERAELPAGATRPGVSFDIAVTSATGSFVAVMRAPAIEGSATKTLERLVAFASKSGMKDVARTEIVTHPHLFDQGAEAVQVSYGIDNFQGTGVNVASHLFVMLRPGSPEAIVFNFTCPEPSCIDDGAMLDALMHDLVFTV